MYLGRIISAGKTEDGKPYVAYRVSSRSFPNRQVKVLEDEAAIIPKEGFETDIFKNSYSYFKSFIFIILSPLLSL